MSTKSRALSPPYKWTTRDGSLNGRPRRKRSLIKLKIAVLSPIPSASVITAIAVKAGDCRSLRNANRMSFIGCGVGALEKFSFRTQCDDGIDTRGAARRNPGSKKRRAKKQQTDSEINSRIDPLHFEKHTL